MNNLASPSRIRNFYSGGNVLEYFRIPNREAIKVTWAHRVVGKEELNATLNGKYYTVKQSYSCIYYIVKLPWPERQ